MNKAKDGSPKPKLVTKRITKSCPECSYQLPTACKSCPCGHSFKRASLSLPVETTPETGKVRRTERTKRERPTYYDALEYDHQFPRKKRTVSGSQIKDTPEVKAMSSLGPRSISMSASASTSSSSTASEEPAKRGRGRPVRGALARARERQEREAKEGSTGSGERERDKEEDVYSTVSAEKAIQISIILAELNRKFTTQNFRPT